MFVYLKFPICNMVKLFHQYSWYTEFYLSMKINDSILNIAPSLTFIEFDSQGPRKNLYYSLHMWTTLKLGLAQKQIKYIFHVWHYTDVSFYLTDVNIKESNKHRAPAFTFGNRCVYIYSSSVKKVLQTNNLQSAI